MGLLRSILLKSSESRWLADQLPRYPFTRRAVRRFMPGETLDHALREAAQLSANGSGTIITRLGENIDTPAEANAVADHYLDALSDIARRDLPTHLSVKLTQLGLDISTAHAAACMQAITLASREIEAPVWIDMESSRYTDVTLEVFRRVREQNENVGVCVQAYLQRTSSDLAALLERTTAIRLVKGAYQEPAALAWQQKRDVDESYFACAVQLLDAAQRGTVGYVPAFATHDLALIRRIIARAGQMGLGPDQYEFQMLYGIRTAEQQKLASDGHRVRVLISYGSAWFAWYMRRLAERPANVWFALKSVLIPG
jgi:proline dehydrogenase